MEVVRFTDGPTRCETWKLPDRGWDDWAATADHFLAFVIREVVTEYADEPVEWLEVNHWPCSGRLIVFPSQDRPRGDRCERVCFELSSDHLESSFRRIESSISLAEQDTAWAALAEQVWRRIGECLVGGKAGTELLAARQTHRLRVTGYDYNPGEGLLYLAESGAYNVRRAGCAERPNSPR